MVIGVRHQNQVGETSPGTTEIPERYVAPDIAVDDEEGPLAEDRERIQDSAAGLQRGKALLRVRDGEAITVPVSHGPADLLAEPSEVDDHSPQPGAGNGLKLPLDQATPAGLQQWLGAIVSQRSHALAPSGGKDHGRRRWLPRIGALSAVSPV